MSQSIIGDRPPPRDHQKKTQLSEAEAMQLQRLANQYEMSEAAILRAGLKTVFLRVRHGESLWGVFDQIQQAEARDKASHQGTQVGCMLAWPMYLAIRIGWGLTCAGFRWVCPGKDHSAPAGFYYLRPPG